MERRREGVGAHEFKHVIVCGCRKCIASHRFAAAEPDKIFSAFDDDEEREFIVKKCLKHLAKKPCLLPGLVCCLSSVTWRTQ